MPPGAPAVNFIASFSANMGQAVAARSWLQGLLEAGIEVHAIDVPDPSGRSGHDVRFSSLARPLDARAPHGVNFIAMNPPCLARLQREGPPWLELAGRVNVMLPFWELPRLPRDWKAGLAPVNVVLASSGWIAEAFHRDGGVTEVEVLPLPLRLDAPRAGARARWGIPEDAFLLVASFELASDVARKNPWAVLEAFARAFPRDRDVRLVLKLNNSTLQPELAAPRRRLWAAASDPRIRIVEETLSYAEVLGLYAAADAYVSLHRAEGVGLGLLEAMALGTPVVATAWSGSLDYTSEANALLVPFELVPVRAETQRAYASDRIARGARWAEPDVGAAAACLRRLRAEPELGRRLGARAARDVAPRGSALELDALWEAVARCRRAIGAS